MYFEFNIKHFKWLIIILLMILSFVIPDLFLRYFSNEYIGFYDFLESAPNLFTCSWSLIFIVILLCLPKKCRMISYGIILFIFNIISFSQHLHFIILDRFYGFSDLLLVGEATEYFSFVFTKVDFIILISNIISLLVGVLVIILMKKAEDCKFRYLNIFLIIFIFVLRLLAVTMLGEEKNDLTWEDNNNVKNIYVNFTNYNKSLEVSGMYEYIFRSTYLYFYNGYFVDKDEIKKEIDTYFLENPKVAVENEYTGVFKDKNVIYVLMESIDSWLVTEEVMPTLYKLQNEGLNFVNKYTPTFGGGQTINSEFAMHTGLYAINSGKAIYNYSNNTFSKSLANMFKLNGYKTTSIHANDGDFYNRRQLHISLGFDNYYFLKDEDDITLDYNYFQDTNLVNDEIFNLIVSDEKFLTYIITYSAHLPYNNSNNKCSDDPYNLAVSGNEELSCIRNLARDTDEMLRILIEKLELSGKLDDTVLVLVTDHYTYGYNEEDVKKYKNESNNYLLQNTPFVIWSNDIEHKEVDLLVDTADILPTLFNMFDIDYNPNYYSGEDIFSNDRDNFVYFNNEVFYDGKIFYDDNFVDGNKEYIKNVLSKIENKIRINDKLIISDYFK